MDIGERMKERLDPSALHFKSIAVSGFKVIRGVEMEFAHHNIIRGMNGVGKTTMLHLLAGIAGNDLATDLIADEKIGSIEVILGAGNEEFRFESRGRLDYEALVAFKASLPDGKRANYALTDYYIEKFQFGCCDYATFKEGLDFFWDRTGHSLQVFQQPGRGMKTDSGSGIKQAIKLIYLASLRGGPLMLDFPETSLDHRNKILLSMMMLDRHKQTISVTHADEWGKSGVEKVIEMT